ncbi:MAG: NAD-dependent epimerase/dehydratase family protein [Coriobacteriia bacterium]
MSEATRVAILGATGHVGACLTESMSADSRFDVVAVGRDGAKLDALLASPGVGGAERATLDEFPYGQYDAIVNCIGEGDPAAIARDAAHIFEVTERFDGLVMGYLEAHPTTRCVCFSSGAAYGGDFSKPAAEDTVSSFPMNHFQSEHAYGAAKLAGEARHRAASDYPIVDLRLFGFFSHRIDLDRPYFMNDVATAILSGTPLRTGEADMIRDYVDPFDLAALVSGLLTADTLCNDVLDVYSASPVSKFAVLEDFAGRYDLAYTLNPEMCGTSATGTKAHYYSTNRRAAGAGYAPTFTSLEALRRGMDRILFQQGRS